MTVYCQQDSAQKLPGAILDENYGCMMSVKNDKIVRVPLSEVAGKLKYVDPKSEIIRQAKITGISFGDE